MISSSTRVTGLQVTRFFSLAVLTAALAACGGGGGDTASTSTNQPTGDTVIAQANRQAGVAPVADTAVAAVAAATTAAATTAAATTAVSASSDAAVRVNTDTAGSQTLRAIGASADGGYTVAWLSALPGSTASVRLQHFDAGGARAGIERVVTLDNGQNGVAAAALPDGGLAVATAVIATGPDSEPWITRTSIVVRRHDANGSPLRTPIEVAAVAQDRTGATTMRFVAEPSVARWADGSFVVGWQLIEETAGVRTPQAWTQRFDALGNPVGAPLAGATGATDTAYQLIPVPTGGYIVATSDRVMGRTFIRYAGFGGAVAPVFPAGALGAAEGSLLLPLQGGGLVLFSPSHNYGGVQRYAGDGQPTGPSSALATMPVAVLALPDGGWMTFSASGGSELAAQRYDASGQATGQAFAAAPAAKAPQGALLPSGATALAWTSVVGGDADVMAQRLAR